MCYCFELRTGDYLSRGVVDLLGFLLIGVEGPQQCTLMRLSVSRTLYSTALHYVFFCSVVRPNIKGVVVGQAYDQFAEPA